MRAAVWGCPHSDPGAYYEIVDAGPEDEDDERVNCPVDAEDDSEEDAGLTSFESEDYPLEDDGEDDEEEA